MKQSYLLDKDFLMSLQSSHHREIYARITTLSWDEHQLEYIEGKITGGNINIDGTSALRRTCSLTMIAQNVDLSNFHWGMHTKIRLEIGLLNKINSNYPDICWFNQGLYIITSLSITTNTNSYTINISGKDKMCLLNGDVGGNLPSTIDWGIEDYTEIVRKADGTVDANKTIHYHNPIPIQTIIREAVQNYGNELAQNIIINDVEDYGVEMIDYKGNVDMYLIYNEATKICENMSLNGDQIAYMLNKNGEKVQVYFDNNKNGDNQIKYQYNIKNSLFTSNEETPTSLVFNENDDFTDPEKRYNISKIQYGTSIGYRRVDLTYAGDLITNVGDTLITMLDKIKQMLGDFEYFYNLDGQFVFQKKPIYIDHNWNSLKGEGKSALDVINVISIQQENADIIYKFDDSNLITSFSNTPDIGKVKNDFIIWGTRTMPSGAEIPIHLRYAIDEKPNFYYSLEEEQWYVSNTVSVIPESITSLTYCQRDWRELIYKMAIDYRRWHQRQALYVKDENEENKNIIFTVKDNGKDKVFTSKIQDSLTGYHNDDFLYQVSLKNRYFDVNNELIILYPEGKTGYEQYYTDLVDGSGPLGTEQGFWRYLYDPDTDEENPWTEQLYEPENLIFWFDFLDINNSDVGKYSVHAIGDRTKAVNDSKVKAIFYRETPNVIFLQEDDEVRRNLPGYVFVQLPSYLTNMFSITRRGKDAVSALDEMLYEYSYCAEGAQINALPVYHLQPNTRISVRDEKSGVDGQYLIQRISIPLTYNGTMSINATKAFMTLQ